MKNRIKNSLIPSLLNESVDFSTFEYALLLSESLSDSELDTAWLLAKLEENIPELKNCLISFFHPRTTDRKVISGNLLSFTNRHITIKASCFAGLFGNKRIVPGKIYTFPFSKIINPKITVNSKKTITAKHMCSAP